MSEKAHILGQLVDGVGEVKRSSASHVNSTVWGNNLVFGYVPYTTNIFHYFYFKRVQSYKKTLS